MHIGQPERDVLLLCDRLAVDDALLRVRKGRVEHGARQSARDGAERDARQIDDPLNVRASVLTETGGLGDEGAVKDDVRHPQRAQSKRSVRGADFTPSEATGTMKLPSQFGRRGHQDMTAFGGKRHESFAPVSR